MNSEVKVFLAENITGTGTRTENNNLNCNLLRENVFKKEIVNSNCDLKRFPFIESIKIKNLDNVKSKINKIILNIGGQNIISIDSIFLNTIQNIDQFNFKELFNLDFDNDIERKILIIDENNQEIEMEMEIIYDNYFTYNREIVIYNDEKNEYTKCKSINQSPPSEVTLHELQYAKENNTKSIELKFHHPMSYICFYFENETLPEKVSLQLNEIYYNLNLKKYKINKMINDVFPLNVEFNKDIFYIPCFNINFSKVNVARLVFDKEVNVKVFGFNYNWLRILDNRCSLILCK